MRLQIISCVGLDLLTRKMLGCSMEIRSPWIHQLKRTREVIPLSENKVVDVAIIGGGIAGISTAYFTLKNTDKSVLLIESDKVAHGATGHNAGQIVSYFERQLSDLVGEFGLDMTSKAQAAIDSAWTLLEEIYTDASLQTPFAQFTGYAGCQDLGEIIVHLENNKYGSQAKINVESLMIAKDSPVADQIPDKYDGLYALVPQKDILAILETTDERFIAAVSARKGCMNSALFCEELVGYLMATYPDRFSLAEGSHVKEVCLKKEDALLLVLEKTVTAKKVVLCTNGFEKFTITNLAGGDINTNFHHLVTGRVGYMAGYLEEHERSPIAISYLPPKEGTGDAVADAIPYFYLTRRTYESEENQRHSLICIGGPESKMDDTNNYTKQHPYPDEAQQTMDEFLHHTYKFAPKGEITYQFKWHGLMGYTTNGVRCVGPEPINPVLMYNLGCNGIGILPSIFGGEKISLFIRGDELEPSIFDPKDSR